MRTTSHLLLAIAAVVSALAAPVAAALAGGWQPIPDPDINDPQVQALGSWAVAEHMKLANDRLTFVRVVSGEEQVVSGMNYRLVVDAVNLAGQDGRYDAVVYEQSWTNTRKLVSFSQETN